MEVDMATEKLVQALAKPMYVYRMAKPMILHPQVRSKSAQTRVKNAEKEIEEAVLEYIAEKYPDAQLEG